MAKAKKLTGNQIRILTQLADGHPPSGFSSRGIDSLVNRGLVTTVRGSYRVNRRFSSGSFEVYRLTEAGVEALKEEVERCYRAALRKAKSDRDTDLRLLKSAETSTPAPPTPST
jgi:hypothetical protein